MHRSINSLILKQYHGYHRMYVPNENYLAPWIPTPLEVVEEMLELAEIKPGELLCDIGSGDGRILVAASRIYGIKSVGYEQDKNLAKLSRKNIKLNGLKHLAKVIHGDVFNSREDHYLTDADLITLYLYREGMELVRKRLAPKFKDNARIVSHLFAFENVKSRRNAVVQSTIVYVYYAEDLKRK